MSLKKEGCGYNDWTLVQRRALSVACFAFVDDTDLTHSPSSPETTHDQLTQEAQQALALWENLLTATGGALAPEKSCWCLVEVTWKDGKWTHATATDRPGALTLQNGQAQVHQCEVTQDNEALGTQTQPDGVMT